MAGKASGMKGVLDPRLKPYHLLPADKGPQTHVFRLTLDGAVFDMLKNAKDITVKMGDHGPSSLCVGAQEHALETKGGASVEDLLCMQGGVVQCIGPVTRKLVTKKDKKAAGGAQLRDNMAKIMQDRSQKSATIREERPEPVRKRKHDGPGDLRHDKARNLSSPPGLKELEREELRARIIHALAVCDLTSEQVSRQCLLSTEREPKGVKIADICAEVADWGKGVSAGTKKTFRLKHEMLRHVQDSWYTTQSDSRFSVAEAKQFSELAAERKRVFEQSRTKHAAPAQNASQVAELREQYAKLYKRYQSLSNEREEWFQYFSKRRDKATASGKGGKDNEVRLRPERGDAYVAVSSGEHY